MESWPRRFQGRGLAVVESSDCSHRDVTVGPAAEKTTCWPSGEMAAAELALKSVPGGGDSVNRVTRLSAAGRAIQRMFVTRARSSRARQRPTAATSVSVAPTRQPLRARRPATGAHPRCRAAGASGLSPGSGEAGAESPGRIEPSGRARSSARRPASPRSSRRQNIRLAGEHLEQHHAERPDVRALVGRLALGLLRRHVGGRAENRCRARAARAVSGRRVSSTIAADGRRRSSALARPKSSTFTVAVGA